MKRRIGVVLHRVGMTLTMAVIFTVVIGFTALVILQPDPELLRSFGWVAVAVVLAAMWGLVSMLVGLLLL